MKYKLAVFDLDGTLLDPDDELRPETAQALKELYDSGVKLMICSGRAPSMAKAYFLEAGVRGFIACANGAYIENEDGGLIHSCPIETELVVHIIEELRNANVNFSLMTGRGVHIGGTDTGLASRFQNYAMLSEKHGLYAARLIRDRDSLDLRKETVYKIPILEIDPERIPERIAQMDRYRERLEITASGPNVIDLTAKGSSKGNAVDIVVGYLSIREKEVCCMGDYDNDVSMFRYAGLSVAMGNAPDYAKEAADHITGRNDENGAAVAIRQYLLSEDKRRTV